MTLFEANGTLFSQLKDGGRGENSQSFGITSTLRTTNGQKVLFRGHRAGLSRQSSFSSF